MHRLVARVIPHNSRIKSQIMLLVTVGIFMLALISSLLIAWVTGSKERDELIEQGLQLTSNFAEQSVLAMLFESGENAEESATATLAFPDVIHVSLRQPDDNVLLSKGKPFDHYLPATRQPRAATPRLVVETYDVIYFSAPIFERPLNERESIIFPGGGDGRALLGYADIIVSKAALNKQRNATFIQNISVSMVVAALLLLVLRNVVARITTPLSELSELMRQQDHNKKNLRAQVKGPVEIRNMARTFNAMMDVLDERDRRLRYHNDYLEHQVKARTRELMDARDAAILASQHKSAFLANMSHELRTPMNAVLGYTEMVIQDMRADDFRRETCLDDLSRVENAGRHLLSMINNILDLAKIEAGRMEVSFDTTDIHFLAQQVEDSILPLILSNNNELKVNVETDDSELTIDAVKLRQILINLLGNSSKFTKDGVIIMNIKHDENALYCSVTDTGIGMTEAQQEKIFKAFRQGDMATTKNYGGTGLGLAISQKLCRLMGGSISVVSEEGKGSMFYFTIPLPMEEHQPEEEQPKPAPAAEPEPMPPPELPPSPAFDENGWLSDPPSSEDMSKAS